MRFVPGSRTGGVFKLQIPLTAGISRALTAGIFSHCRYLIIHFWGREASERPDTPQMNSAEHIGQPPFSSAARREL